jgi:hypothetical protein
MNIVEGPMFRVAYVRRGGAGLDRVALAAHHLAADYYSMPIVAEDLITAYTQFATGRAPSLPRKTAAFRTYVRRVHELGPDLARDAAHWSTTAARANELPVDRANGGTSVRELSSLGFSLGAPATAMLLSRSRFTYRTHVSVIVLAAVLRAVARTTGIRRVVAHVANHGRTRVVPLDVTRTVGCFAYWAPVAFDVSPDDPIATTIEHVRAVAQLPHQGISDPWLRYCSTAASLPAIPGELYMNFRAAPTHTTTTGPLRGPLPSVVPLEERYVHHMDPDLDLGFRNLINVWIREGALCGAWGYSSTFYHRETVSERVGAVVSELGSACK